MMRRAVSAFGTALLIAGVALLGYVAYQYHAASSKPAAPKWSAAQANKGRQIAAQLTQRQTIKVPKLKQNVLNRAGKESAVRMIIPKIGVNAPVVQTAPVNGIWEVADWSVGHLSTTPNPGVPGNAAYSAHDDIKGEIFKRVGELQPGDQIKLLTQHAAFTYVVTGQKTVDPSDTSPLNPTSNATITLISCTPYWVDTQRLIVQAVLKSGSVH